MVPIENDPVQNGLTFSHNESKVISSGEKLVSCIYASSYSDDFRCRYAPSIPDDFRCFYATSNPDHFRCLYATGHPV